MTNITGDCDIETKWAACINEEDGVLGPFETREDALNAALARIVDEADQESAAVGITIELGHPQVPQFPRDIFDFYMIAEHLSEAMGDQGISGDLVDDWLTFLRAEEDSLGEHLTLALKTWLIKHKAWPPPFWNFRGTEDVEVTEEMVRKEKQDD